MLDVGGTVEIDTLIRRAETREDAQALVDWFGELRGRIIRGDMMLGILSPDEVALVPAALRKAAALGLPSALLQLGDWLARPQFGKPNLQEAEAVLQGAVATGVPGAEIELVRLRWFLRRETASAAQQNEAFGLLERFVAERPGDAEVVYFLGLLTCHGFGTDANPAAAAVLQKSAGELGSADALFELFLYYKAGLGVSVDEQVALAFLRRAADAGHHRALYNMGAFHATGSGFPKDLAAAVDWYERAANAGNLRATAMLGAMYARGEGTERDIEHAKELFDEAEYMGLDVTNIRKAVPLAKNADRSDMRPEKTTFRPLWWGTSLEKAGLPTLRPRVGTYGQYRYEVLPKTPPEMHGDLRWLAHAHARDSHIGQERASELPAATAALRANCAAIGLELPQTFLHFVGTPDLQERVRSNTDCFLDVCPAAIPCRHGSGRLVRFLADSQGCLFWYMYFPGVGPEHAVLASSDSCGTPEEQWQDGERQTEELAFVAESFDSFLWRFWIENEIWFAVYLEKTQVAPGGEAYLAEYRRHEP